jgi:hypothetical protein
MIYLRNKYMTLKFNWGLGNPVMAIKTSIYWFGTQLVPKTLFLVWKPIPVSNILKYCKLKSHDSMYFSSNCKCQLSFNWHLNLNNVLYNPVQAVIREIMVGNRLYLLTSAIFWNTANLNHTWINKSITYEAENQYLFSFTWTQICTFILG